MSGRNNRPDKDGVASNPSRLDQFGDQLTKSNQVKKNENGNACDPRS